MTPVVCCTGIWSDSYSGVKRANDCIKYVNGLKEGILSTDKKNIVLGQCRLLRAFYYNQLWKFYGNIPVYFENLEAPYISEQFDANTVYGMLIAELEDILSTATLKDDWEELDKGRVTKPMAYMLYAEMVMIQADQSRYAKALGYMKTLIDSGRYGLVDNYIEIWDEANEWCSESIFEINYYDDNSFRGWGDQLRAGGSVAPRLWGPRSYQINPNPTNPNYATIAAGWGFGAVPKHTVASFDPADARLEGSIIDLDANGTSTDPGWMATGYHTYKYVCKNENNKDQKADADLGFNNNLRVYRYAETLLNYAELVLLTGGAQSEADEKFNKVRTRAGLPAINGVTRDQIIEERRFEFVAEGKRYFDLVRTGKAASVLTPANDSGNYRTKGWSEAVRYFPIPQADIDAANGTLKQNGNY